MSVAALAQTAALIRALRASPRHYAWFAGTIAVSIAQLLASIWLGVFSNAYLRFWLITDPFLLLGILGVALEILSRIPKQYDASHTRVYRRLLLTYFQIALLVALGSAIYEALHPQTAPTRTVWLMHMLTIGHVTHVTVAVLLFLVSRMVALIRVPFQKNLIIHTRLFGVWVVVNGIATFLTNMNPSYGLWFITNVCLMAMSTVLFAAWAILLKREGETPPPRVGRPPEEVQELKSRSEEIIGFLQRAVWR